MLLPFLIDNAKVQRFFGLCKELTNFNLYKEEC